MTRTPTHLGDGAYVQDDPHVLGGIVFTTGTHDLAAAEHWTCLDAQAVAALLRWLDADPKAEIVAWLRERLADGDLGCGPETYRPFIGQLYTAGYQDGVAFVADAIDRGDYKPVPK